MKAFTCAAIASAVVGVNLKASAAQTFDTVNTRQQLLCYVENELPEWDMMKVILDFNNIGSELLKEKYAKQPLRVAFEDACYNVNG